MRSHVSARFIPNENCQRIDPRWDWSGVRILGNSQCMGNGFEDMLNAIAMETGIRTLSPGDTYNYYALFFGYIKQHLKHQPRREHYMSTIFHAVVVNKILESNNIRMRVRRKSTHNIDFALAKLGQTERIILLSINSAVGRHIIRVNSIVGDNVNVNDPFGKNPYNVDKVGGFKNYTLDELHRMGINSVCWIEDV